MRRDEVDAYREANRQLRALVADLEGRLAKADSGAELPYCRKCSNNGLLVTWHEDMSGYSLDPGAQPCDCPRGHQRLRELVGRLG